MAKKKSVEKTTEQIEELTLGEKLQRLKAVTAEINSKAKNVVCGFIDDEAIRDKLNIKFVPTPNDDLNEAVGGGFPRGTLTIVSGLPDSGKTGLLLETIGLNMQKDPKFTALWLESEHSLSWDYMVNTFGIDPTRFIFVQSSKDGAEIALDRCEKFLHSGAIDMFVINSLRALVPRENLEKSISENTMATQARMNTKMVNKYSDIVSANDIAFVIVQHLTTQIGGYGDPFTVGGGYFIKHMCLLLLDMRKQTVLDTDPIDKEEGMKVMISIKKNHVTPRVYPYVKVPHFVIYDEGTEVILTTLNKAIKQGIVTMAGAWINWPERDLKWQGKENFRKYMREHPDDLESLRKIISGDVEELTEQELKELNINIEEDQKELEEELNAG